MVRITSRQPRKQRKARYDAPLHARGKFLNASLSPELSEKYGKSKCRVIVGDTVKIRRGDFRGDEGLVEGVDTEKGNVIVHGVFVTKVDGTEVPRPVNASNVMITKLKLEDKLREERLEAKN